jgi:hypothetical protein
MVHVKAPSKGLSYKNVFFIGPMVTCACYLLSDLAKVSNFQYRAWLCSMDQKFHVDDEKTRGPWFWDLVQRPTVIIRPKSQNSKIRHDGILSIWYIMLMINNHFARFQLPGNFLTTKQKCSLFPWQHGIVNALYRKSFRSNWPLPNKRPILKPLNYEKNYFKLTQAFVSRNFFKQFIVGMNVNHESAGSTCKNMKISSWLNNASRV